MDIGRKVYHPTKQLRYCSWFFAAFIWVALGSMPILTAQVSLDLFGGANTNAIHLTGKSSLHFTPRVNTLIGVQSGYHIADRWALNLAVQYAIRGYGDAYYRTVPPPAPTSPVVPTTDFRFHYIDLVPKATFDLTPHFRLDGGVYTAYLVDSYIREVNTDRWEPLDFGGFFSDWDFGLVTGFSIHYQRVFFFANFNWSIYPLASFNYTGADGRKAGVAHLYNRTFQMGIGCSILKGGKAD